MEKRIDIKEKWMLFPVQAVHDGEERENHTLEIFCQENEGEKKLFEFQIPILTEEGKNAPVSYYACVPVKEFVGKIFILRGELPEVFFKGVRTVEMPQDMRKTGMSERPFLHFTPRTGWMNDPNGLVYAKGCYHLYFQYNPFDTQWENMCWGHAVSRDLLHWEQKDTVLFPDENGTIFSGSGIVNERKLLDLPEDALLFFYTAAGGTNTWSKGKESTQRLAYSIDDGETLLKTDMGMLDTVSTENRDPKVFWHEESRAYIMVLWLEKNDFGIFRSEDLREWKMSDRIGLEGAWECPDLVRLEDRSGEKTWMFWSADGYYFWGDFDGYCFKTDGVRHEAYINRIPYAAQTYSGVSGRVISVPWLKLSNRGRNYTGAMGLPREFSFCNCDGEKVLTQVLVREYEQAKQLVYDTHGSDKIADAAENMILQKEAEDGEFLCRKMEQCVIELRVVRKEKEPFIIWNLDETEVTYQAETGKFSIGTQTFEIRKNIRDFSFILDDVILEITAERGTVVGIFELWEPVVEIRIKRNLFEGMQIYKVDV